MYLFIIYNYHIYKYILKFILFFEIFNIEGYLEVANIPHDSKNDTLLGSRSSGMINIRKSVLVSIKSNLFLILKLYLKYLFYNFLAQ